MRNKMYTLLLAGSLLMVSRSLLNGQITWADTIGLQYKEIVYLKDSIRDKSLFIAYPSGNSQRLPAIIHFHGGGFRKGKASLNTALKFAKEGFIGISIHYSLSFEKVFPAAVHDGKTAIRWVKAHADEFLVDTLRIGLFGGSAGGHLATLIGLSSGDQYLEGDGPFKEHSSQVQVISENYGPTDFLQMNDHPGNMDHNAPDSPESEFLGGPIQEMKSQAYKANPINYIDGNDPPVLIIHGKEDMSVPFHQSQILFNALQEAGVTSRLIPIANAGHGFKPSREGVEVSPNREEIFQMHIAWFKKILM